MSIFMMTWLITVDRRRVRSFVFVDFGGQIQILGPVPKNLHIKVDRLVLWAWAVLSALLVSR